VGLIKQGESEMTIMKSLAIAAAMLGTTALVAPVMAQESSYKAGSVWTSGRIHILPGQFENYMDWLSGDWKRIREFGKKEGVELSYHVLQVNNPRKDEPNLILLIEYKDYLTNAQQDAFNKKLNAYLASDDRKQGAASASRGAMREQWGSTEYQELILK
jgi:hypothetical protein